LDLDFPARKNRISYYHIFSVVDVDSETRHKTVDYFAALFFTDAVLQKHETHLIYPSLISCKLIMQLLNFMNLIKT
jgi:hypothetical protein